MENFIEIRTDLAIEAREMITKRVSHEVSGVDVVTSKDEDVLITRVNISNQSAEEALGKPKGKYITIEAQGLQYNDGELHEKISGILADELHHLVKIEPTATVLVVGLGNRNITPDALGPKTIEKLVVTRHMKEMLVDKVKNEMRLVCAIEPGVLGITGIETAEIIQGLVAKVKPDLVIAIDALAAAASHRVNTTIQLANTGIHPGSGVDNKRFGLNEQTLGVPVIAIGVPTVVHASTIAMDTIHTLKDHASFARYFKSMETLSERECQVIIRQVLPETLGNLMVTPKEIDQIITDISMVVAEGLNRALHEKIDYENIHQYIKYI
ncbi:GPR endopeptidase [Anaerosinus massiliensis]|uniref:GPR endopeptidase n=1 Tax=Massilibacillus massiliensis TaxID=1806837 RepID=UPI000A5BA38E|nr:GPR endopeptidase [Massilibacillus massiliensis]